MRLPARNHLFIAIVLISSASAANIKQVMAASCRVHGARHFNVVVVIGITKSYSSDIRADQTPFSFNDIFNSSFRPRSFSAQWIDGTDVFLYRNSNTQEVMRYNATDNTETTFINKTTFAAARNATTYFVSNDLTYVLFAYNTAQLWRHSFTAKYVVLRVSDGEIIDFPKGDMGNRTLQYAGWASKVAENYALTFVVDNNLFYQKNPSSDPVPITNTGDPMNIYNGVPDWLYEEDVLGTRVTHYSSSDAKFVCYAQINDTEVPLQAWPWYGDVNDVYGSTIQIPYPKAGDITEDGKIGPNSKVKLFIYDVDKDQSTELTPPTEENLLKDGYYYTQAAWLDTKRVMITWANRVQNESWSVIYDASKPTDAGVVNHHIEVTNGWVEVPPAQPWPIDEQTFLTIFSKPLNGGQRGTWRHLSLVNTTNIANGELFLPGIKQFEEVESIVGYNRDSMTVYYISTGGDPSERHLYQLQINSTEEPKCLSCGDESCRYVTASFSSTSQYYILGCRGPEIPVYTLKHINSSNDKILENNDEFRANIATKQLPTRDFVDVPLGDGYTGRAEIFYPPGYVKGNSYPLLVFAYAGPGSQRVMKTYPIGGSTNNWLTFLKSTHKVVVASLDARGSAAAGDDYKFQMYRKLSVVEIADQLTGGEFFRKQDVVNESLPSAIFGWSYGGGVAAHATGDSSKTFQCGVSVAPVTTKAYYDTAYTERYLGFATDDDNAAGYDATNVMNKAKNFLEKEYMIAHGTSDDNVHFMHAAHLIRALSEAGVQFRQDMYVDQNHGISSPNQSRHLYQTMTNFLINDCWKNRMENTTPKPDNGAPRMTLSLSAFALLFVAVLSSALRL